MFLLTDSSEYRQVGGKTRYPSTNLRIHSHKFVLLVKSWPCTNLLLRFGHNLTKTRAQLGNDVTKLREHINKAWPQIMKFWTQIFNLWLWNLFFSPASCVLLLAYFWSLLNIQWSMAHYGCKINAVWYQHSYCLFPVWWLKFCLRFVVGNANQPTLPICIKMKMN